MMTSQMVFTGAAGCPTFSPNTFKADMCCLCQNKIQSHAGATDNQVQVSSSTCHFCRHRHQNPVFKIDQCLLLENILMCSETRV